MSPPEPNTSPHSTRSLILRRINNLGSYDFNLIQRPVITIRLDQTQSLNQLESRFDTAENRMFSIQPRRRGQSDEELTSVGILAAVGHTEDTGTGMFQRGMDLIFEFIAVNTCPSAPCACWVARLDHEVGDDAMEYDAVVVVSLH